MSKPPTAGNTGTLKVGKNTMRVKFISTVNKGYSTGNLSFAGAGARSMREHWTFVPEGSEGKFMNYAVNEKGHSWDFTPNAPAAKAANKAANTRRRRSTRKRRATRKSRR